MVQLVLYMSDRENSSERPSQSTDHQLLIVGTFLDTTWRMFVPILATTLLGYVVDKQLDSLPVYVLVGLGVGVLVSALLVWQQYKAVKRSSSK